MSASSMVDLVDDDPAVVRALSRLLRAHGYQVRSFCSGPDFLNALTTSPLPDCLVLDVQMSAMSGLDLHAKLGSLHINLPVIFITAHEDPQAEQVALATGATAFLYKPLRAETLFTAIRAALDTGPSQSPPR